MCWQQITSTPAEGSVEDMRLTVRNVYFNKVKKPGVLENKCKVDFE
jgi:hypothetical protein